MTEGCPLEIEKRLADVPGGTVLVRTHTAGGGEACRSEPAESAPDGKGAVESWEVFSGAVLTHSLYRAGRCALPRAPRGAVMHLSHCRLGCSAWEMRGGAELRLGPGELSLHMADECAGAAMSLPLGYYEGVAILVDLDRLERKPPEILREAGMSGRTLYHSLCGAQGHTVLPAGPRLERIFSELCAPPPQMQLPYFKLKVQELLLLLSIPEQAPSQQVQTIRAIHRQLTEHLDRRFTIEELSRQYLINTSSLKAAFKSVYGAPVGAYMRQYRIRRAAGLLRETRESIAEIAAQVGYENQSKFTAAFQQVMNELPSAYRRRHQKSVREDPAQDQV